MIIVISTVFTIIYFGREKVYVFSQSPTIQDFNGNELCRNIKAALKNEKNLCLYYWNYAFIFRINPSGGIKDYHGLVGVKENDGVHNRYYFEYPYTTKDKKSSVFFREFYYDEVFEGVAFELPLYDFLQTMEDVPWDDVLKRLPEIDDYYDARVKFFFNNKVNSSDINFRNLIDKSSSFHLDFSFRFPVYYIKSDGHIKRIEDNDKFTIRENTVLINIDSFSSSNTNSSLSLLIELNKYK